MRRRLALAALILSAPAWAGGIELLHPDDPPGTWDVVTLDDATTTSRCIGSTDTPICAFETLIACRTRQNPDLCETATDYRDEFATKPFPDERSLYRIRRAGPVTTRDLARQHLGHLGTEPWLVGDFMVEAVVEGCAGGECFHFPGEMIYVLRHTERGWKVVSGQPPIID